MSVSNVAMLTQAILVG